MYSCSPEHASYLCIHPPKRSLHVDVYYKQLVILCVICFIILQQRVCAPEVGTSCFKVKTVALIRNVHYSWLHYRKPILQRQLLQALQLSLTLINTRHFAN